MKFSIITFCLLISNFIGLVFCECLFSVKNYNNFDLIIQQMENFSYMVETSDIREIYIPDNEKIELYCHHEFEINLDEYNRYDEINTHILKDIQVHCKNGKLEFKLNDTITKHFRYMKCNQGFSSLYPYKIPHCDGNGFLYGVTVKDTPIIFAEFCYDIRMSNLIFAHYFAGQRSPILENQTAFNPSNMKINVNLLKKLTFLGKSIGMSSSYNETIQLNTLIGPTEFEFGELIQFTKYTKIFENILTDKIDINTVIWWSPLKNGNWKLYEDLLEKYASKNNLDIFAGTSSIISYPYVDKFSISNDLLLEINGTENHVPLLMWHYVKNSKTDLSDKDVVIVGVNSPFFQGSNDNTTIICKDICDEIPWLESLRKTRKMAVFGYIFCCKPNDVKYILDGFPNVINETSQLQYSTEKNIIEKLIENSTPI